MVEEQRFNPKAGRLMGCRDSTDVGIQGKVSDSLVLVYPVNDLLKKIDSSVLDEGLHLGEKRKYSTTLCVLHVIFIFIFQVSRLNQFCRS